MSPRPQAGTKQLGFKCRHPKSLPHVTHCLMDGDTSPRAGTCPESTSMQPFCRNPIWHKNNVPFLLNLTWAENMLLEEFILSGLLHSLVTDTQGCPCEGACGHSLILPFKGHSLGTSLCPVGSGWAGGHESTPQPHNPVLPSRSLQRTLEGH